MIEKTGRIGVEIITRNRADYLAVLLRSLLRQTKQEWDLFLLDNSDTPSINHKLVFDVLERIRDEGHLVIYDVNNDIPSRTNIGLSRNMVHAKNDLDLCCRIDDDSWCEPDYLERLYNIIITDDKIGAAGGTVPYFGMNPVYKKCPAIFNKIYKEDNVWQFADDGHWSYNETGSFPSHHLRSSFLYRKKALEDAGGNVLWSGSTGFREETAVSINMMLKGWKLVTDPKAKAWHLIAIGMREDVGEVKMKKQQDNEKLFRTEYEPKCEELLKRGII